MRDRSPGIRGLHRLLTEYGEAIEFDIARYWPGRRLHDLFTGAMTWRELRTFIRRIPADSAYVRAAREALGEDPDWSVDTHILRVAANAVTTANYQRAGKRTPKDALIPEPGKPAKKPRSQVPSGANGAKKPGTWKDLDALF